MHSDLPCVSGDKPRGTMWSVSCTATPGCADKTFSHTCDSAGGQSGSAMYDKDYYVRAVHKDGSTNVGVPFRQSIHDAIQEGRRVSSGRCLSNPSFPVYCAGSGSCWDQRCHTCCGTTCCGDPKYHVCRNNRCQCAGASCTGGCCPAGHYCCNGGRSCCRY